MKKILGYISMLLLIICDQIIKINVVKNYDVGEGFPVIKDILEIEYVQNTGAAWGMMSNATWFFAIFALIITSILLGIYYIIPEDKRYRFLKISMILIVSGAVGNLIDRVVRGYVVDYIYFKVINFPVFNLADIFITVAGIALVILILFYYKDEDFDFIKIKKNKQKVEINDKIKNKSSKIQDNQ